MRLQVLGDLTLKTETGVVSIGPPQHRAVLAALLLDVGRPVAASVIIDRVWGESAPPSSTATLHAVVSRLRSRFRTLVGHPRIATSNSGYRLDLEPDELDSMLFTTLVARARQHAVSDPVGAREDLSSALRLWQGDPFADTRTDATDFEAARLSDLRLAAIELAADLDLRLARPESVVAAVPSTLATHPLREQLAAALMTAYYRVGRQADALATFAHLRRELSDQLGADPMPTTAALHAAILRGDLPVSADTIAARPPGRPAVDRPLIGRSSEQTVLRDLWTAITSGPAATVVIDGEAGIGKTRLLEDLSDHVGASGAIAWGHWSDRADQPANWPWTEVLTHLSGQYDPAAVSDALAGRAAAASTLLLDRPRPADSATSPAEARALLHDGVLTFLNALAADKPVLILLEDLQWADPDSARLTSHLVASRTLRNVLLATTRRTPSDASSAASDLLADLSRQNTTRWLHLNGFDQQQSKLLATALLQAPIGDTAAARLHDRTDGNPFFITELARLLSEERRREGRAELPVPETVQAALGRRLHHLPHTTREALTAGAVLGRQFSTRVLADLLDVDAGAAGARLDDAVASGVIAPTGEPGTLRFSHALVQETLHSTIPPGRRSMLHARAADALQRRNPDGPAAAILFHLLAAGPAADTGRTIRATLAAAAEAEQGLAHEQAVDHLRHGLTLLSQDDPIDAVPLELELRTRLGALLTLQHGYNAPEVVDERRRAYDLTLRAGTDGQVLAVLWAAWGIALVSGHFDEAANHAERLQQAAHDRHEPLLQLAHDHALGQILWHRGQLSEAADLLARAAELAEQHSARIDLAVFLQHPAVTARAWLAVVRTLQGAAADAETQAGIARHTAARLAHAYTSTYLDVLEGWRGVFRNEPAAALTATVRGLDTARRHQFAQLEAFLLAPHGWALAGAGHPDDGVAALRQAITAFAALPDGHMFGHLMYGALADALTSAGRVDDALAAANQALAESSRTGERFYLPAIHLRIADLLAASGADPLPEIAAARAEADSQGAAAILPRIIAASTRS